MGVKRNVKLHFVIHWKCVPFLTGGKCDLLVSLDEKSFFK